MMEYWLVAVQQTIKWRFMKKLWIFILGVLLLPGSIIAQQKTEYNIKGDDAMARQDYRDAKMWYEEGAVQCDPYSVNQLTTIWLDNEEMRLSMRSIMSKCLNCLIDRATENDTTAIKKLIVYYSEGIGTSINEEYSNYWKEKLESYHRPPVVTEKNTFVEKKNHKPRKKMKFFIGYSFSPTVPYGITIGGVARRGGWYARFKTNMSFRDYTKECNDARVLDVRKDVYYQFTPGMKKKTNSHMGTAGLVIKCTPWLYTSVGLGYGERSLLWHYTAYSYTNNNIQEEAWCKNIDSSYKGIAGDIDVMVKLGPVYISAGCSTISFEYIDLNAGLGVFF